jgi:branched-chain amino acid transport system permease protein
MMKRWVGKLFVLLLFVILPQVVGPYYVSLAIKMLIFAIFAMSLDLLVGYLGLPSLGHAAFFGVAAYTVAVLSKNGVGGAWLNLMFGIGMAGAVAAVFGLLALRTRGSYFFMITLALTEVLWGVAHQWRFFTGGDDGIPGIARPNLGFMGWSLEDTTNYFYFVLFFFAMAYMVISFVVHSVFGYIVVGIRENELRMRSLGHNTWLYQYALFILSGLFAGLAGTLSAHFNGFVSPVDLSVGVSAEGLLMVLFGGTGTLLGPAIGAGSIVLLKNVISTFTARWLLILGMIYVLVVIFAPQGVLGIISKLRLKDGLKHQNPCGRQQL